MGNISARVRERQDQNQRGKDTGERNDQEYDDTNAEDNKQEKSNNEANDTGQRRNTHGKTMDNIHIKRTKNTKAKVQMPLMQ